MNKKLIYTTIILIVLIVNYGFLCPFLVSYDNNFLVIVGVVLLILPILLIINYLMKQKNEKKN